MQPVCPNNNMKDNSYLLSSSEVESADLMALLEVYMPSDVVDENSQIFTLNDSKGTIIL